MAKKVLLTVSEFVNQAGETKKKKINIGFVKDHEGGGMSISIGVVEGGAIANALNQAIMQGKDTIWLSIFDESTSNQQQQR